MVRKHVLSRAKEQLDMSSKDFLFSWFMRSFSFNQLEILKLLTSFDTDLVFEVQKEIHPPKLHKKVWNTDFSHRSNLISPEKYFGLKKFSIHWVSIYFSPNLPEGIFRKMPLFGSLEHIKYIEYKSSRP